MVRSASFIRKNDDTRSGLYLQRHLEQVMPKVYEKRYPKLHASNGEDLPINTSLEVGATELVEEALHQRGTADMISFDSDDYPTVDISMEEKRFPVQAYGTAIRYNDRELSVSARSGRQLRERRLAAARYYLEEKINRVAYFGEPRVPGFTGLLNNPSVPIETIDDINFYDEATPDELAQVFFDIANATDEETNMVEETNILLVPNKLYNYMQSKRMTDGDSSTVLSFILEKSPYIKAIRRRNELNNSFLVENGVENDEDYDRIISYSLNPDTCERYIEPIQLTAPLRLSLHNWTVGMFTVTSPAIMHYPSALRYTRILSKGVAPTP